MPKSQAPRTLAASAYQQIEEMIVKGVLQPGARITESLLSTELNLGRTPIREALQRLAAEGTVRVVPRSGVIISEIEIADQFCLIEVRRELERIMSGRAARLASPEDKEAFLKLAADFRAAGAANDAELFMPADREFNAMIARCSHNKYAVIAMSAIQAQTRRFWYLYFSRFGDLPRVCELHASLGEAIAAGEESHARQKLDDLIDYVEYYTRRTLSAMYQL